MKMEPVGEICAMPCHPHHPHPELRLYWATLVSSGKPVSLDREHLKYLSPKVSTVSTGELVILALYSGSHDPRSNGRVEGSLRMFLGHRLVETLGLKVSVFDHRRAEEESWLPG